MSAQTVQAALASALLALALAAPARAASPDTLRLSLDQAIQRALAQGEEMRAARAFVSQTGGRVREEISRALPQIDGTVSYNRKLASIFQNVEGDTVFGPLLKNSSFAAANTWSLDLTATQLLWSGGKVGSALKAARAANRSARASAAETASDVTFQVRQAYYDADYARRLVEIAEGGLAQARAHLHQVRLARAQGDKAEYDQLRAEVDAANQEPAVVAARNGGDIALLALKRLVNLPLNQAVALTTPLAFEDGMVPVAAELETSVAKRPALLAAEAEVDARRYVLNVNKGRRWPDLSLSSTLSHQAFPRDEFPARSQFRRNWDASIKLEVPIFSGLRTEGQIQQARADLEKAAADRDRLRESAAVEAAQARAELQRSLSTLMARRQTVRQAQRAWELAGVRYRNGMSVQIEVSDTRLQLQTAEVNEVQATRDYLVALAQLERAVGHPVPVLRKPLEQVTQLLSPEGRP